MTLSRGIFSTMPRASLQEQSVITGTPRATIAKTWLTEDSSGQSNKRPRSSVTNKPAWRLRSTPRLSLTSASSFEMGKRSFSPLYPKKAMALMEFRSMGSLAALISFRIFFNVSVLFMNGWENTFLLMVSAWIFSVLRYCMAMRFVANGRL